MYKKEIISRLQEALEPLSFIHTLWLEGADAIGTTDEYSDIDLWVKLEYFARIDSLEDIDEKTA